MLDSMVLPVFVKLDIMKFQDLTVKDAQMDNIGMVLNVHGIQHVQVDIYGILNIVDVMLKPFHAHKMLNGTVHYVYVQLDII